MYKCWLRALILLTDVTTPLARKTRKRRVKVMWIKDKIRFKIKHKWVWPKNNLIFSPTMYKASILMNPFFSWTEDKSTFKLWRIYITGMFVQSDLFHNMHLYFCLSNLLHFTDILLPCYAWAFPNVVLGRHSKNKFQKSLSSTDSSPVACFRGGMIHNILSHILPTPWRQLLLTKFSA